MGFDRLPVLVLQEVAQGAVEDAQRAGVQGGCRPARVHAGPSRLAADDPHGGVVEEGVEQADGVRSAADARDGDVGQPARQLEHLGAGLLPDDPLKVAHERREGVRARRRAEDVVRRVDVGHPVAEGLVDRVLERGRPRRDRDDLGAEDLHARHVQGLAAHVLRAHVYRALQAEQGGGGRGGDAVLARAGLGDDPGLAHRLGEERLAQHVVDLVRARVVEVLAFEQDAGPARVAGELRSFGEDGRAARVGSGQTVEFGGEGRVDPEPLPGFRQVVEGRDERLGDVASPEIAEVRPLYRSQLLRQIISPLLPGKGGVLWQLCHESPCRGRRM